MLWALFLWLSLVGSPQEPTYQYIIIDIDPTPLTGPLLASIFHSWHLYGQYFTTLESLPLAMESQSLWVIAGMFPNSEQIPESTGQMIEEYLQTVPNARFYLEGGDVFAWDPQTGFWDPKPWMGILQAEDSGFGDEILIGVENSLIPDWVGDTGIYTGEYSWVDQFSPDPNPPHGGTAEVVLLEPDMMGQGVIFRGIAYDQGSWKTMAFTMEAGGLTGTLNTAAFAYAILSFFDIPVEVVEDSLPSPAPRAGTIICTDGLLRLPDLGPGPARISLINASGRMIWTHRFPVILPKEIRLSHPPSGLFFLSVQTKAASRVLPVLFLRTP